MHLHSITHACARAIGDRAPLWRLWRNGPCVCLRWLWADSPQAANRYDNAVATVENVTALVTSDDNNNEARVIELLMKDGSRKEEHKLSKEELHELIVMILMKPVKR